MSIEYQPEYELLGKSDLVILRTLIVTDRDHYLRWQTQGEWLLLDAPWEQPATEEKKLFMNHLSSSRLPRSFSTVLLSV